MATKDTLGDQMKYFEAQPRTYLIPKVPVLIRLDGKAFHTLTRNSDRPYDRRFAECMWATAQYLAEHVSGCRIAYTQSDEISLLLTDYDSLHSEGWFRYDLQKMVSVSASMAGVAFAAHHLRLLGAPNTRELPVFDSRAWSLPRERVLGYFAWRQNDATRNSIQMLGQTHFSHKQLHGKSCDEIQGMLLREKDVNWNDCCTAQKRGVCIRRVSVDHPATDKKPAHTRRAWVVDTTIPVFTADRDYVERHVWPETDGVRLQEADE